MVVKVDEAREDEVVGFERWNARQIGLFALDVLDSSVQDVEPRIGNHAVGRNQVAANEKARRRLIGCTKLDWLQKGSADNKCSEEWVQRWARHDSPIMP
jgi:hypothetical protein